MDLSHENDVARGVVHGAVGSACNGNLADQVGNLRRRRAHHRLDRSERHHGRRLPRATSGSLGGGQAAGRSVVIRQAVVNNLCTA